MSEEAKMGKPNGEGRQVSAFENEAALKDAGKYKSYRAGLSKEKAILMTDRRYNPFSDKYLSASSAAMQPLPAAVTAWR